MEMMENNCHSLQIIESLAVKLKYLFKKGDNDNEEKEEEHYERSSSLLRYSQYVEYHLSAAVLFHCKGALFAEKQK